MPLAGGNDASHERSWGSEPNAVPLDAPQGEDSQVSVKNTFIEVGSRNKPIRRSVTVANVSSSSSSDQLQLPLDLSNSIPASDVPVTPSAVTPAYFDAGRAQSPMSRWFDGSPSDEHQVINNCADAVSPLARWLQGSPVADGGHCTEPVQKQGLFNMGPECSAAPGQLYLAPFSHLPMPPMMAVAVCPTASNMQAVLQTAVQPSQQAMAPQQGMLQQQIMPVWTQQVSQKGVLQESVAANSQTAKSGVWDDMVAWKAQQTAMDGKKALTSYRNAQGMTKRRSHCEWKETKPQYSISNQKAIRPRGRTAISRLPAHTTDSVGPRAVFVDLSKIVPTGMMP
eukprot:gnl/MRDRNA2_/MRDRNA2_89466_c0_seq1.p1 gnl/MRDRNA2_/MRDRNA2_89466_c0~~gnl/MRDRNA2_/MRDRNA2_89466_c0_seq1.p1  ORF type:complete len:339 (+),score=57.55 gnl/MRDRNA2_/MRDRNA2_89466_c0_seq1:89-1105(+)